MKVNKSSIAHREGRAGTSTEPAVRVLLVAPQLTAVGLRHILAADGGFVCVGEVASAAEGVLRMPSLQPNVIVLDMDGEDGTDALVDLNHHAPTGVLAVTSSPHAAFHDSLILAGARGVVHKRESPDVLIKAIRKIHVGEMWIDRGATGRIFQELARQTAARHAHPEVARIDQLTTRERHLVITLASDASAPGKVLAQRLHISEHTLRNHLTSIYRKLGVANRTELYAFAHRNGLARM